MYRIVSLLVVLLIIAGISYAVYQDPERQAHQLVAESLAQAAIISENGRSDLLAGSGMPPQKKQVELDYQDSNKQPQKMALQISAGGDRITLQFGAGDVAVANKSIILISQVDGDKLAWKCLDGTLLIRLRPKDCRLGKAIQLDKLASAYY